MNPNLLPPLIAPYIRPELYDNFPRVHTAIAEWIACMVFRACCCCTPSTCSGGRSIPGWN